MKQLWNGVSAVPRRWYRKGERHWSRAGHAMVVTRFVSSFDGSLLYTQILSPTLLNSFLAQHNFFMASR